MINGKIVRQAVQAMQNKCTNSATLKEKSPCTQGDQADLSEDRKPELRVIYNKLSTRSPCQRLGPPLARSFLWGALSVATGAVLLAAVGATAPVSSLLIQLTFAAIVISGTILILGVVYLSYRAALDAYDAYQQLKHGKSIVGKTLLTEREKNLALEFVRQEIITRHPNFDQSALIEEIKKHFSEIIIKKDFLEMLSSSLEKVPLFPTHLQTALKTWIDGYLRSAQSAMNSASTSTNDKIIPQEIQKVLADEITKAFQNSAETPPDWHKLTSQICKKIEVPFFTYSLKRQLDELVEQIKVKFNDMIALKEEALQKREEELQRHEEKIQIQFNDMTALKEEELQKREEELQRHEEKIQIQSKKLQDRHEAVEIGANKVREEREQMRLQKEAKKS